MSFNPRLIALQGFLLTPIAMAVQGLIAFLIEEEKRHQVYGSGRRSAQIHRPDLAAQEVDLIEQEDQVASELLITLVLKGFFHGTVHA